MSICLRVRVVKTSCYVVVYLLHDRVRWDRRVQGRAGQDGRGEKREERWIGRHRTGQDSAGQDMTKGRDRIGQVYGLLKNTIDQKLINKAKSVKWE